MSFSQVIPEQESPQVLTNGKNPKNGIICGMKQSTKR